MRIVSQDGNFDAPYENLVLHVKEGKTLHTFGIMCRPLMNEYNRYATLFAEYSTKEKVDAAMELLHDAYQKSEKAKAFGDEGRYTLNSVFQFPQDLEIKV